MSLRCRVSSFSLFFATLLLSAFFAPFSEAQQPTGAGKALTVERIYSQPSLSGRLTRGLAWTPDSKQLSYFETKGLGKDSRTELWTMDAASGERRPLVGLTSSNRFCLRRRLDLHRLPALDAARPLNINGRRMERAFCFKVPRRSLGWI